jgi:hypothetical protein
MGTCIDYHFDPAALGEGHLLIGDTKGCVIHFHFRSADQYLFDAQDRRQSGIVSTLESLPRTSSQCDGEETYGQDAANAVGGSHLTPESFANTPVMTCDVYTVHKRIHPGGVEDDMTEEVQHVR